MTQVAASWLLEWGKLCWIGSVLVYILASFSLCFSSQPPLRLRDCRKETSMSRRGRQGHLPPRLFTMYDQHIMTPYTWCPFPHLSVKERKTDTYALLPVIGLGSFGIYELASFKRAEKKKCLFVGLTFLMSLFCLCYFFFHKKQQWKKEGKLNVVEMFQTIMESGVVLFQFVPF